MTAPGERRRYVVWDPLNELEADGTVCFSADPSRAAELYAENDTDGQIAGVYAEPGFVLHVRDGAGVVFEAVVCIDSVTSFEARVHKVRT